jgi:hypothetical protein
MVCFPKGPKDLEEEKNAKAFFDSENQRTLRRRMQRVKRPEAEEDQQVFDRTHKSSSIKKGASDSGKGLRFPAITPGR